MGDFKILILALSGAVQGTYISHPVKKKIPSSKKKPGTAKKTNYKKQITCASAWGSGRSFGIIYMGSILSVS